jgi:hypothetical protein
MWTRASDKIQGSKLSVLFLTGVAEPFVFPLGGVFGGMGMSRFSTCPWPPWAQIFFADDKIFF